MRRNLISGIAGLALAAALPGCKTTEQGAPGAPPLPANYRQMVVDQVRKTFFDPYSIRDASISTPISGTSLMGQVQTVCVLANAKNRMGGYTGIKATAFVFRDGAITTSDSQYAPMICSDAVYEPFPEIDASASAAGPSPPQPAGRFGAQASTPPTR